jgi:SNF2 family DNA or RNA helicase
MNPDQVQISLRVRVEGAPQRQGAISAEPRLIEDRWFVRVDFDDGIQRNTRLDHLEPIPKHINAVSELRAGRVQAAESLRRNILHEKLHGRLSEILYSMETSDTTFLAYQFKPILKLLESPTNSILIADEVGLGKTIEAGLIWTELKARDASRTLLVVCPPHLVEKWEVELRRRFGVDAYRADARLVEERLVEARRQSGQGFALIATYHGLRPPRDLDESDTPAASLATKLATWGDSEEPFLDLLIMEEAAIMRNESSQISKLGALLAPIARHKVYLSATPLHTRSRNLYTLLNRLDPDTFSDPYTFNSMLEANAPLVRFRNAVLRGESDITNLMALIQQARSSPLLTESHILRDLSESLKTDFDLTDLKKRAALAYQSERANLLSYVISRTRRRDVETNPILRQVTTKKVPLSTAERELYRLVSQEVALYALERDLSAGFLTVMPQRQIASCMPAAYARICNAVNADEENIGPTDFTWGVRSASAGPLIQHLKERVAGKVDLHELRRNDSKYNVLLQALRDHWAQHPGGKVVLFAYFKPTLYYLHERLSQDGVMSLMLTGDLQGPKQGVVDDFRKRSDVSVLLSSEVGSEGLDLQFASTLINYDLPWNPMVVEQRIGRIHRIGQEAPRIIVINLICEGTVDERIYDRLYHRLDLFRTTIGDLEAVVGPIVNKLTKDLLSLQLTDEQQIAKIEAAAQAMEQNLQLESELEEQASTLAAYGDYIINQISAAHAKKSWVSGEDLCAYVLSFFNRVFPATRIQGIDSGTLTFTLELDDQAARHFSDFIMANHLQGQTRLASCIRQQVRFDHRIYISRSVHEEIIHQAHPLIRFIGHHLRVNRLVQPVAVITKVSAESIPGEINPGKYIFVSQRWTVEGLRTHERLHHEVFLWDRSEPIKEPSHVDALITAAADAGQDCEYAYDAAEWINEVADIVDHLICVADAGFDRFGQLIENEDEDRKRIQLIGVDRFEERRRISLETVLNQHQAAGRQGLVAATQGQMEALRKKSAMQRDKINSKSVTCESTTIAAGVIVVE